MKDFLFTTAPFASKILIDRSNNSEMFKEETLYKFEGQWGSLLVSSDYYSSLPYYECDNHIFIVIGGPLLIGENSKNFSLFVNALLENWRKDDITQFFDGPFVLLKVNKKMKETEIITDLLSFIPVYQGSKESCVYLSTHVDLLAEVLEETTKRDKVSEVDFLLHGTVTYPYTVYKNICQLSPGTVHIVNQESNIVQGQPYWLPYETLRYTSIDEAASDLRKALESYITRLSKDTTKLAHFISGGEDSRVIAGLIPMGIEKDSFLFLDSFNREGKLAKKAAKAYGSNLNVYTRSSLHYLHILPHSSEIVGSGAEYKHAHTYGFNKKAQLDKYPAVLGGLFSDALLKGSRIKKKDRFEKLPFFPDMKSKSYSINQDTEVGVFKEEIISEVKSRREKHYDFIKEMRPYSAKEWFQLWPASMNIAIPNLYVNRRLFRSYEPFMANEVVKISAGVPQKWKMNRKLFHTSFKPYLRPTWWLGHSDGKFPYFSKKANFIPQFIIWLLVNIGRRTNVLKYNQGPWADWKFVINSSEFQNKIEKYTKYSHELQEVLSKGNSIDELFYSNHLTYNQKLKLLQVLYYYKKHRQEFEIP